MRGWLAAMSHPDGEIGYFNDASVGIAPSPEELESFRTKKLKLEEITERMK